MYVVSPLDVPTYLDFNAPGTVFLICISDLGIVVTLVTLVDSGALLTMASAPCPILVGVVAHLMADLVTPVTAGTAVNVSNTLALYCA